MPRISDYPPSYGLKDSDRFVVDDMSEDQTLSYTGKQLKNYVNDVRTTSSVMAFDEAIKDPEQYMNVQNEATGKHSKLQMVDMDRYIKGLITGLYRFRGTVSYNDLVNKTGVEAGDVYNVNEKFITTDAFLEGSGKTYDAGTNVVWTDQNKWDVMGGLSIDLSDYATNESVEEKIEGALNGYRKIINIEGPLDLNELITDGIYLNQRINAGDRLNEPEKPEGWDNYTDAMFLETVIIEVSHFGGSRDMLYQKITDLTKPDRVEFSRLFYNNKWMNWRYNKAFSTGINNDGIAGYFEEGFSNDQNKFHFFGEELASQFYTPLTEKSVDLIDNPTSIMFIVNGHSKDVHPFIPEQMKYHWITCLSYPRNMTTKVSMNWSSEIYQTLICDDGSFANRSRNAENVWTGWIYTPPAANVKTTEGKGMYIHKAFTKGFGTAVTFGDYLSGEFDDKNGAVSLRAINTDGEKILDVGWNDYHKMQTIKLPFGFDIDENGNYGYLKQNENTVDRVFVEFGKEYANYIIEPIKSYMHLGKPLNGPRFHTSKLYGHESASVLYPDIFFLASEGKSRAGIINIGAYTNNGDVALPFSFGVDANGNYGYFKKGSNTVTPFPKASSSVTVEAIESDDGLSGFSMYDNEFIQLDVSGRTVNNKFNLTINNLGTQTNGILELPFSFGLDANGNYGYKKNGADTVIPFKSIVDINEVNYMNAKIPTNSFTSYIIPIGDYKIILSGRHQFAFIHMNTLIYYLYNGSLKYYYVNYKWYSDNYIRITRDTSNIAFIALEDIDDNNLILIHGYLISKSNEIYPF